MDFPETLQQVCKHAFGATANVVNLKRLTAGSAAQTWKFDLQHDDGPQGCILRLSHDGEQFEAGIKRITEAQLQNQVHQAGVPVARVLYCLEPDDGLGDGYIMEYLAGETIPQRILKSSELATARSAMTQQCAQILAKIHSIDTAAITGLPGGSLEQQLLSLEQVFLRYRQILPVFSLAFSWLKQHLYEPDSYHLVHGDFRNGNFIVDQQGIRAVLDWELAHIGDPLEDLAWLCMVSWRFADIDNAVGGFGDEEQLYRFYENYSGRSIDHTRLRFWQVFAALKWGVICLYQCFVHLDGHERSVDRVAIGRRVSECELNILMLLKDYADVA